jgi:hypothetical protein
MEGVFASAFIVMPVVEMESAAVAVAPCKNVRLFMKWSSPESCPAGPDFGVL